MEDYKELVVWQKSMQAVKNVYSLVKKLPKEEQYTLSDQMRRAAVSIPSNIAEGFGRHSAKDYSRFLSIARGSKYELETQLRICIMLGYLSEKDTSETLLLLEEVGKMLNSLMRKLTSKQ